MKISTAASSLVIFVIVVHFALAGGVRIDYDRHVTFSNYRSFMWINEPATPKNPRTSKRIVDVVNAQLTKKGLEHVWDADLAVSVNIATRDRHTLDSFYRGFDGWVPRIGGTEAISPESYADGTIILDIFDAHLKQVVWRGVGAVEPSSESDETSRKLEVEAVLAELLKDFPPKLQ